MDKNAERKYVVTGIISHIKYADDCKVRLKAENTWKSLDGKEVLNIFKCDSDAELAKPDKLILVEKELIHIISLLAVNGSKAKFKLISLESNCKSCLDEASSKNNTATDHESVQKSNEEKKPKYKIIGVELSNE